MRYRPIVLVSILAALLLTLAHSAASTVAQRPAQPSIQWTPCDDVQDTDCAFINVPVDPANPGGAMLALRIARVPATDQAEKRGMLLIIPGGPGVGIADTFGNNRVREHVDDLSHFFDVVSFDPRGVDESNPIRCAPDLVPAPIFPFSRPPTQAEFDEMAKANAAFVQSCFDMTGELMGHLSSMDTAADIEQIRLALTPNDGLVANAASYGTAYAAAYLENYGDHAKTLVLDGITDHSIDTATDITRGILATQDAFDRMGQWCNQTPTCALYGQDVGAAFDAAIANAPEVRTIVPLFMAAGSDPELGWPAVAQMLAQVSTGDTSLLDALAAAAGTPGGAGDPSLLAGKSGLFLGVVCGDYGPQRDYAALIDGSTAIGGKAPRFAWKFWDATPQAHRGPGDGDCIGWPFDATNPPHLLQVGPHPNVLIANSVHDSSTPLTNAINVWSQIPDARLLISDVDGHQSLFWSACAWEMIRGFLLDSSSLQTTTFCSA
jgi:pimeloyl-ACP methyl ester carboxylesterase